MIRVVTILAFICLFSGCVTPGVSSLGGLDYPLADIQKGISKAFPVDFKNVSRDGLSYETYPFVRNGRKLVQAKNELERGRAIIEIRGTTRPYTVDVTVNIEEALSPDSVQKNFKVVGYDDVVAKIFLARLRSYLLRTKKSLDMVDDVRVY